MAQREFIASCAFLNLWSRRPRERWRRCLCGTSAGATPRSSLTSTPPLPLESLAGLPQTPNSSTTEVTAPSQHPTPPLGKMTAWRRPARRTGTPSRAGREIHHTQSAPSSCQPSARRNRTPQPPGEDVAGTEKGGGAINLHHRRHHLRPGAAEEEHNTYKN